MMQAGDRKQGINKYWPYECVPRGQVEGEVIKPELEWNLEWLV